ncbi:Gfo/Idh/MocA family oxidoreductase [Azospirillum sp. SYSU D00513]|uniref:Gfo/Idh/MocA family protein n=1 Tax=Azospirillum sp. SYSU D00513 TaxID=2812561 RepID=UPI001A9569DB|nr:Gfo/Idh/MocA family oxidoreductase [Azospirillum sp. SYSU D00513]
MSIPTLGLVGVGKIARDQHLPSIAETGTFRLAALVSPEGGALDGVPTFRSQAEMLAALPDLDAVSICTPPGVRHELAAQALRAGKHVLIEKPPAATVSELHDLVEEARAAGRTLFTAWHSQFNGAVDAAKERLAGARVRRVTVDWKEDVRRWHPGQEWIWQAGGFGVFDPGINALSILTRILPGKLFVREAELLFPENRDTPIAVTLAMSGAAGSSVGPVEAVFDFRQEGEQTWTIAIETDDGTRMELTHGGTRLFIDGAAVLAEPDTEYRRIYRRFGRLVEEGAMDVDAAPLHLVADAYSVGRRRATAAFHW